MQRVKELLSAVGLLVVGVLVMKTLLAIRRYNGLSDATLAEDTMLTVVVLTFLGFHSVVQMQNRIKLLERRLSEQSTPPR